MKQLLRLTFLALVAMVCNVANAQEPEVTLDFTDNTVWNFPAGSTKKGTAEASFTNGTYTVKVAGENSGYYYVSNGSYLLFGKLDAYVELPAFSFDVERIDVEGNAAGSGSVTQNIFVGETAVSTQTTGVKGTNLYEIASEYQAAGNVYKIKVTNANNSKINKILVWKKGTAPAEVIKEVNSIKEFIALGVGKKGKLTLTNAKVSYANGNDIYVTDATGGIDFYKTSLTYKTGDVLNGSITASYAEFNKLPELMNVVENNLTATEGTVEPVVLTPEEAASTDNICKLVTVKNITLFLDGTKYYTDADKTLQVYDKFKINYTPDTENAYDYTGVVIPYSSVFELLPTKAPELTTGINGIVADEVNADAPVYNLAGQRVNKNVKGILIKNGKAFINK